MYATDFITPALSDSIPAFDFIFCLSSPFFGVSRPSVLFFFLSLKRTLKKIVIAAPEITFQVSQDFDKLTLSEKVQAMVFLHESNIDVKNPVQLAVPKITSGT